MGWDTLTHSDHLEYEIAVQIIRRERVNSVLGDMLTDGRWRRIVDRWFPETDELPRLG